MKIGEKGIFQDEKDEKKTDNGKKQGFWAKLFSSDISNYQDETYGK